MSAPDFPAIAALALSCVGSSASQNESRQGLHQRVKVDAMGAAPQNRLPQMTVEPAKHSDAPITDKLLYTAAEKRKEYQGNKETPKITLSGTNVLNGASPNAKSTFTTSKALLSPIASPPLPSLLRYVDNHLTRNASMHNKPPSPSAYCSICGYQHNLAPIASTFLPLSPCGHWVHYRCFIWWTAQAHDAKDKCPSCTTKLFDWDGINSLTLATRTGLKPEDQKLLKPYTDPATKMLCGTDAQEYVSECTVIESLVRRFFFARVYSLENKFTDQSPDLMLVYNDVYAELQRITIPKCKWLKWNTETGFLLFGMLVAIKMRRWLLEEQGLIVKTEGWRDFEKGMAALQERILKSVRDG